MSRTVLAVFDSKFIADKAVHDLRQNGLSSDMVEMFARPARGRAAETEERKSKKVTSEIFTDELGMGMRIGAGIGGGVGVAAGLLTISGKIAVPFLTALLVNSALAGAGVMLAVIALGIIAGALTGGLFGSLLGLGISEAELHRYARSVRDDQVVVAVMADWVAVDPVLELLGKHDPLELAEKVSAEGNSGPVENTPNAPHGHSMSREHEKHQ